MGVFVDVFFLGIVFSKVKDSPSQHAGSQEKVVGGLC